MDTIDILIDTIPPSAMILASNNGQLDCVADTVVLDGSNSTPMGNLNYFWTTFSGEIIPPFNTPTVEVIAAGNYTLTVINLDNGCEADTMLFIDQDLSIPNIAIAPPDMLTCAVTNVTLDATNSDPNSQFEWTSVDGFAIQNPTTATPTVMDAGEYLLEITSNMNGCDNSMNVIVNENVEPPIAVANALGSLDCVMTETQVSGFGSSVGDEFEYLWTGGTITTNPEEIEVTVTAADTYTLLVENTENGCTETATTEVITTGAPITNALISHENIACNTQSTGFIQVDTVIGGTPPFLYNFGSGTFIEFDYMNYLIAGEYPVQIQDADGCEWSDTITIAAPSEITVDAGLDVEVNFGDSITLEAQINVPESALDTVIWTPLPDSTCIGCLTQTFHPTQTITYQVEVIDTNGCAALDIIRIIVPRGDEPPVFIPDAFTPNNDGVNDLIYPYAGAQVARVVTFRIFDRWGSMVHEALDFRPNDPAFGWDGNLGGEPLNPAVFVWWLEVERVDGTRDILTGDLTLVR